MTKWLTCIDCDADYKYFAVGREDGTVVLSDLKTGEPQWVKRLHDRRVTRLVFNQETLLTTGFDGMVVASNVKDGEELWRFDAGHGRVFGLTHLSDTLLTAGDDGHVRVWNMKSQVCVQTLEESRCGASFSVCMTPDWIAIGYENGYIGIWKPTESAVPYYDSGWQNERSFHVRGRKQLVAMAVSSSGKVAAFAREGMVSLFAPGEWKIVAELTIQIACNDLQFNSEETLLIGACSDRQIRLWDNKPVADNPYGEWTYFPRNCGEGMGYREFWGQEMIFSGARFAGSEQIIAASFDGSVRMFPTVGTTTLPSRIAWYKDELPGGWGQVQSEYADLDGDGTDELLVQYPMGAHGTALQVFGYRRWVFKLITEISIDTPAGFVADDIDGDGRLEVITQEVSVEADFPYVMGFRDEVWYRLENDDFVEVKRVNLFDKKDLKKARRDSEKRLEDGQS